MSYARSGCHRGPLASLGVLALCLAAGLAGTAHAAVLAAESRARAGEPLAPGSAARVAEQLEAEINRSLAAARARRRLRVTASTRDADLAAYYNAYAQRIECISERNYPQAARGRRYHLMVTVSVLSDGSLEKAEIDRPSGSADVDSAVLALARSAAPYEPFPVGVRERYDALELGSRWDFAPVKDDGGRAAQCRLGAH